MKIKGVKDWEVFDPEGKTIKFDAEGLYETEDRKMIGFLKALGYHEFVSKLDITIKEVKIEKEKKPDMKILDK